MANFFDTVAGQRFCCNTMPDIAKSLRKIAKCMEDEPSAKEVHYRELLTAILKSEMMGHSPAEQIEILKECGFADADMAEFDLPKNVSATK